MPVARLKPPRPDVSISADEARALYGNIECLYPREQIESAIDRAATRIGQALEHADPLLLCVMHGGLNTMARLLLGLPFPLQIDYLHVSRYRGSTRGGIINWHRQPALSLRGRVVLLVDDILDEGHTLAALRDYCRRQGAHEVRAAVLVDKRHDRKCPGAEAEYVMLTVEDRYVFGYGMDYGDYFRNLAGIYALQSSG